MKKRILSFAMALVMCLSFLPPPVFAEGNAVEVVVREIVSGAPIANAAVSAVDGETARTGSNGAASLTLEEGSVTVEASADGYQNASLSIEVTETDRSFEITLEPDDNIPVEITTQTLTAAEIAEAGLPVENPEEAQVYESTAVFSFGILTYFHDGSAILDSAGGGPLKTDTLTVWAVAPEVFLILDSRIHWPNAPFRLQLLAKNTAEPGEGPEAGTETAPVAQCSASLTLSGDLALAALPEGMPAQSAEASLDALEAGGVQGYHWYLTAGAAGKSALTGSVTVTRASGDDTPENPVTVPFNIEDAMETRGWEGLTLAMEAEKYGVLGEPYPVSYTLENGSETAIPDFSLLIADPAFVTEHEVSALTAQPENGLLSGGVKTGLALYDDSFDPGETLSGTASITFGKDADTIEGMEELLKALFTRTGANTPAEISPEITLNEQERILITLDPDGGTVKPGGIIIKAGEACGQLPTPTRKTDVFQGWFTEDNTQAGEDTVFQTSATLRAEWEDENVGTVTDSGYCGAAGNEEGVTWAYYSGNVLKLKGTGAMADYSEARPAPWNAAHSNDIYKVYVGAGITNVGKYAFYGCDELEEADLGSDVKTIGISAFSGCAVLGKLTLREGLTTIGGNAFQGCGGLAGVEIPGTVTRIGAGAFQDCAGLYTLSLPDSVETLGSEAFAGCKILHALKLSSGLTEIEGGAFRGCETLPSVEIPEGVTTIAEEAFQDCTALGTVTFPSTLTEIGRSAFQNCVKLSAAPLPEGVTTLGDSAFSGCAALASVTLPEGIQALGTEVFKDCASLPAVWIPDGVTRIGDGAFQNCVSVDGEDTAGLAEVTIPVSVESFGRDSFTNCAALTDIYYGGDETQWNAIEGIPDSGLILTGITIHYLSDGLPYTVTFDSGKGSKVPSQTVRGGEQAIEPAENPVWEGNTFQYWTLDGEKYDFTARVTEDMTLTAQWDVTQYTIRFVNADGSTLSERQYPHGTEAADVELPPTPEKAPTEQYTYVFRKWTPDIVEVTADAVYTAAYTGTIREYTIRWENDDGSVLASDTVTYGKTPSYSGPTPEKASTEQSSYSFRGWTPQISAVKGEAVYTAEYAETVRKYTITYQDEDGTVLATETLPYGAQPSYTGTTPEKPQNGAVGYQFAHWSPALDTVTGDTVYTAVYTETLARYTVRFCREDGTEISSTVYDYGTKAGDLTLPDNPPKPGNAQYRYFFDRWTPELSDVTEDVVYRPSYQRELRTYTITWKDEDGTVLRTDTDVPYGTFPNYEGEEPQKPETDASHYTFAGWTPELKSINGDKTFTASYQEAKRKYTVRFLSEDGQELSRAEYDYGTSSAGIVKPKAPDKAGTERATYRFDRWTPQVAVVTGDADYSPVYRETLREFTVTFIGRDGTELSSAQYPYGTGADEVEVPSVPERENTPQFTFQFTGWSPEMADVTEDVVYTAVYTSTVRQYTIRFLSEAGEEISSGKYEYGTAADAIQTPDMTRENTAQYAYEFAGWTPRLAAVTENRDYTAVYHETVRTYTVEWQNEDGTILRRDTGIPYGTVPEYRGDPPVRGSGSEYHFGGWTPSVAPVTGNAVYTAVFTPVPRYSVIFRTNGGSAVAEQSVLEGEAVRRPADPEQEGCRFVGWRLRDRAYDFSTPVTESITLDAAWEVLRFTVTFDSSGGSPVSSQTVEYGSRVEKPYDPILQGCRFTGWIMNGTAYDFATPVTRDLALKAQWSVIYRTVTFDSGGGTAVSAQTVRDGEAVRQPSAPVRPGYAFVGWTRNGIPYEFATPVYGDLKLTAEWEMITWTVTFDSVGGSDVAEQIVQDGQHVLKPDTPLHMGYYRFIRWQLDGAEYNFDTPVHHSFVLTALWEPVTTFQIRYDANGGIGTKTESLRPGDTFVVSGWDDFSNGYREATGWNTEPDGTGSSYPAGTYVTPNEDITLYLQWGAEKPPVYRSITFDPDGGVPAPSKQSVRDGDRAVEPTAPVKTGYRFRGWFLTGATAAYDFQTPVAGNLHLTALWEATETGTGSGTAPQPTGKRQGCYVATAVYGSYDCPEVWTLRRFRDQVLAKTWYGRFFIRLYYAVSPTAVKLFGGTDWFRQFFRNRLDAMVSDLQNAGFTSTPYQDPAW